RHRRRLQPGRGAPGVPEQARSARGRDRTGGERRRLDGAAKERRGRLRRPRSGLRMILLIDNYDSFTYNLAHLFGELGAEVVVRRNDAIDPEEAERLAPSHLVLSP